jgi:RecB family exonuclease
MELEIWKKKLVQFVQIEKIRADKGYKVYAIEQKFDFLYKDIKLRSIIDRIDKVSNSEYEILDYKTSSSLKIDTAKTYLKSIDFQLEFYYLALNNKNIKNVSYYDLYNMTIKNETMLYEKVDLLKSHLDKLHTKIISFDCCEDSQYCQYCEYNTICDKN